MNKDKFITLIAKAYAKQQRVDEFDAEEMVNDFIDDVDFKVHNEKSLADVVVLLATLTNYINYYRAEQQVRDQVLKTFASKVGADGEMTGFGGIGKSDGFQVMRIPADSGFAEVLDKLKKNNCNTCDKKFTCPDSKFADDETPPDTPKH